jgi:uncharacterized protein YpuA (DUF1002 family)
MGFFEKLKRIKKALSEEEEDQTRLAKALNQACTDVAKAKDDEWAATKERDEKALIREYETQLATQQAVVDQYVRIMSDLKLRLENSQKAYQNYVEDVLDHNRRLAEHCYSIDQIFDTYQAFQSIKDSSEQHLKRLRKTDAENRELLSLSKNSKLLLKSKQDE